jgi:hypothetical protein
MSGLIGLSNKGFFTERDVVLFIYSGWPLILHTARN